MNDGEGLRSLPARLILAPIRKRPYLVKGIVLALALALSLAFGAAAIAPGDVLAALLGWLPGAPELSGATATILNQIRIPHTVLVALTGAALATSGAAYQGVFRNPLADPYLIGVASGAGLGAVLVMARAWPTSPEGFYAVPAAAFLGALLAVATVYSLARVGKTLPVTTLILAGAAIAILPPMVIYILGQRFFVESATSSGVKG